MNSAKFDIVRDLSGAMQPCTDSYGVGSPDSEWPNNILSNRLAVSENAVIYRKGDTPSSGVDPKELDLCRTLAIGAWKAIGDIEVGMGSESGDTFSPFLVCATNAMERDTPIDEELIRQKFGRTIFPLATITIEPLQESGIWWNEISVDSGHDENCSTIAAWRNLILWFGQQSPLSTPMFVRIGDRDKLWEVESQGLPDGTEMTGCVLPRLAIARTGNGSIVGVFGCSVQT